jgi:hypothetical protein
MRHLDAAELVGASSLALSLPWRVSIAELMWRNQAEVLCLAMECWPSPYTPGLSWAADSIL